MLWNVHTLTSLDVTQKEVEARYWEFAIMECIPFYVEVEPPVWGTSVELYVELVPVGLDRNPVSSTPSEEVIAATKKQLKPGTILDGGGGYTSYGFIEKAEVTRGENLVPFELTEGGRVIKEIPADGIITYEAVELKEESFLLKLWREQDSIFY